MESLAAGAAAAGEEGLRSIVDSFLVEALEIPRHRSLVFSAALVLVLIRGFVFGVFQFDAVN